MHIMNAMVAAVNAYQYYQRDVERAYHDIEASMSATKTHTHNQAADVQVRCPPPPPPPPPLPSVFRFLCRQCYHGNLTCLC